MLAELEQLADEVPEIWRLDAIAYVYGAMNEIDKEQVQIEEALRLDGEHTEVLYHYAKVLVKNRNAKAIEIAMKVIQKDVNNERIFDVYVKAIEQHKKWSNIRDFLHILKVKKAAEVWRLCMQHLRLQKGGLNVNKMNSRRNP